MPPKAEQEVYIREFCARVQKLREARGKHWTQAKMAKVLGISTAAYSKYEIRSPIPHYLLAEFAFHTDCSLEYLITGEGSRSRK